GGGRDGPRGEGRRLDWARRPRRLGSRFGRLRDPRRRSRRRPGRNHRRLLPVPRVAFVKTTSLGAPRPIPGRLLPVAAGAGVIALALPVFLVAGWPVRGWAIAALVWIGVQGLGLLLSRVRPSADNLAASSVLAFGM